MLEREYYYSKYGEEYDEGDPNYYDDEVYGGYENIGKYTVYWLIVTALSARVTTNVS